MKKEMLILATALTIGITGCSKESPKIPEQKPVEQQQKKEVSPRDYKGLKLGVVETVKDGNMHVKFSLENTTNDTIPLNYDADNLIKVTLNGEDGNVAYEGFVTEKKRKSILPFEELEWEQDIPVKVSGDYTLSLELSVKDTEKEKYTKEELLLQKTIEVELKESAEMQFLPKEPVTYTYNSPGQNGQVMTEEYKYFEDNYIQSENTMTGTNVYYVDKTGLFLVRMDYVEAGGNVISDVKNNEKDLLLKFPVQSGTKWDSNGQSYVVISSGETVTTTMGKLNNVVKVKTNNGSDVFMYYHKDYGLVKVQSDLNGSLVTQFELVDNK
jgi:hypothetical protein